MLIYCGPIFYLSCLLPYPNPKDRLHTLTHTRTVPALFGYQCSVFHLSKTLLEFKFSGAVCGMEPRLRHVSDTE